jgi:hypothetical protein
MPMMAIPSLLVTGGGGVDDEMNGSVDMSEKELGSRSLVNAIFHAYLKRQAKS